MHHMSRGKVISREYKVVLRGAAFTGNESAFMGRAKLFWKDFKNAIASVASVSGSLDTINKKREILFFDSKEHVLHNGNYIFRERKNAAKGATEITLKFRHADRYVSQDRDMDPQKGLHGKIKFEEDIKSPFQSLYSFSSSLDKNNSAQKLKDIVNLYPGLAAGLENYDPKEKLVQINEHEIQEIVITGGSIVISDDPPVHAECALIMWYEAEVFSVDPVIAEFSFRYGNEKGKYSGATGQVAFTVFARLQKELKGWIDIENATKTGFIYKER